MLTRGDRITAEKRRKYLSNFATSIERHTGMRLFILAAYQNADMEIVLEQ